MPQLTTIIARCTTRLQAGRRGQEPSSSGTGFYYSFPLPGDPSLLVFVIVTNKHVVQGFDYVRFVMSSVPPGHDIDALVPAGLLQQRTFELDVHGGMVVHHPDAAVDLCALVCSSAIEAVTGEGRMPYAAFLNASNLLPPDHRVWTRFMEPVVMVGYPKGLWDHVHDMPIIRRGTTATHPLLAHRGRPEFVIDMACLPGSSGSPVFLFEDGIMRSGSTSVMPGSRFALLGVLWGGPQMTLEGRIEVRPVPHASEAVAVTSAHMNLGYVVSADQLEPLVRRVISLASPAVP